MHTVARVSLQAHGHASSIGPASFVRFAARTGHSPQTREYPRLPSQARQIHAEARDRPPSPARLVSGCRLRDHRRRWFSASTRRDKPDPENPRQTNGGASERREKKGPHDRKSDEEVKRESSEHDEAQQDGRKQKEVEAVESQVTEKSRSDGSGSSPTNGNGNGNGNNGSYGSGLRRATRNSRPKEIPPITIPAWFLKSNVRITEQRYDCMTAKERDDCDKAGRLSVRLTEHIPIWGRLRIMIARDSHSFLGLPLSPRLDDRIRAEIMSLLAASLSLPSSDIPMSLASARSNLLLHSPQDGAIKDLFEMLRSLADSAYVRADLITIEAHDIADLAGSYMYDGSPQSLGGDLFSPTSQPVRNLSFEAHSMFPTSDEYELDTEETEAQGENGEKSEEVMNFNDLARNMHRNRRGGKKRNRLSQGAVTNMSVVLPESVISMFGGGRGGGGSGVSAFAASTGRSSSGSAQWDEIKLAALLDAMIDAGELKRQVREERATSPQSLQTTSPREVMPTPGQESDQSEKKKSSWSKDFFSSTTTVEQRPAPSERTSQPQVIDPLVNKAGSSPDSARQPADAPRKTIVCIPDIKEIARTDIGPLVLQKLIGSIRRRRKDGQHIMLVGLSSRSELAPEFSVTGVRSFQQGSDNDSGEHDEHWQHLLVPCGNTTTEYSNKLKPTEDYLRQSERERTTYLNLRHLQSMLGLLQPTSEDILVVNDLVRMANKHSTLFQSRILHSTDIHRIAMAAVAMKYWSPSRHMSRECVDAACYIVSRSDNVKYAWATEQGKEMSETDHTEHRSGPSNDTSHRSGSPSSAAKSFDTFLSQVQKNCNKHEQSLLPGIIKPTSLRTTFDDVHLPSRTISTLKTLTSLSLQRPDAFTYGVLSTDRIAGVLLYGPPGTGKTLLAKAVAAQSGAVVLQVSGSDLFNKYVGESEKLVRALFSLARKLGSKAPCVVFIDEADSIFSARSNSSGGNKWHRSTLNEFLKEWDGVNEQGVFIMAATNRPFDVDDAVLRRLPRRLLVDLPDKAGREGILRIHLRGEQLGANVHIENLAERTPRFSGSDLKNMAVAAALAAVKEETEKDPETKQPTNPEPATTGSDEQTSQPFEDTSSSSYGSPETSSDPDMATSSLKTPSERKLQQKGGPSQKLPQDHQESSSTTSPSEPRPRRILQPHHFDQALTEIAASVSDDMSSLIAIRKFDEQYGDNRTKKKSAWGFGVVEEKAGEKEGRIRK